MVAKAEASEIVAPESTAESESTQQGNSSRARFTWLPIHDEMLRKAIERIGGPPAAGQWKTALGEAVPGRSAKQMRERWRNNLDPSLKFGDWTVAENTLLCQLYVEHGSRWSTIAKSIDGEREADR